MYYDPKESGKRIQTMRNSMGLTQEQLAERLKGTSINRSI